MVNRLLKNKRAEINVSVGLFITLAMFLSLTAYLIGNMPETLATGPANDLDYLVIPEAFDFLDLTEYGASENFTLYDGFAESWGKDTFGHDMRLIASDAYGIYNTHFYGFLNWYFHQMVWTNASGISRGDFLSISEIILDADAENISRYRVSCEHFTMEAYIGYDRDTYDGFEDAWTNDELLILFTIGFDEIGTTWNAWSLIGNILTFRAVDVGPPFLTYVFALILYTAIAGLLVIIIISVIPFT